MSWWFLCELIPCESFATSMILRRNSFFQLCVVPLCTVSLKIYVAFFMFVSAFFHIFFIFYFVVPFCHVCMFHSYRLWICCKCDDTNFGYMVTYLICCNTWRYHLDLFHVCCMRVWYHDAWMVICICSHDYVYNIWSLYFITCWLFGILSDSFFSSFFLA